MVPVRAGEGAEAVKARSNFESEYGVRQPARRTGEESNDAQYRTGFVFDEATWHWRRPPGNAVPSVARHPVVGGQWKHAAKAAYDDAVAVEEQGVIRLELKVVGAPQALVGPVARRERPMTSLVAVTYLIASHSQPLPILDRIVDGVVVPGRERQRHWAAVGTDYVVHGTSRVM